MDEEDDDDEDNGRGEDCGMTRACTLLHDVANIGDTIVHAMQAALTVYIMSSRNESTAEVAGHEPPPGCCDLSLFELFKKTNMMSSLAALSALSQTATELTSLCEWNILLRGKIAIDADNCQQMLISTVVSLLILDGGLGELLLASNASAVHLIWQYLSQEESLLSSQPIAEILLLTEGNGALSNGFISIHPSSVGWAMWLIAYATSLADSAVVAAGVLNELASTQASSSAKQVAGQEKEVVQVQIELFEAMEALSSLTYTTAGCSVVVRIISRFCFKEVLKIAMIGSDNMSGSSINVLSSAARLVFYCALSGDSLVLGLLSGLYREQVVDLAKSVIISPPLSLSDLEESVTLAQLGQVNKSSDPRHKIAPVKVVRGYTDDARHLAQRILNQFRSEAVTVENEGDTDKNKDKAEKIEHIKGSEITLIGCNTVIKMFANDLLVANKVEETGNHNDSQSIFHQCIRNIPSLSFAANMLLSSIHSEMFEGELDEMDIKKESALGIAYDGDLLHALLNVLDLMSFCIRVSNLSKMRYGATNPSSVDSLILVEMVKCCPTSTLLSLKKKKKGINGAKDTDGDSKNSIEATDAMKLINVMREIGIILDGFFTTLRLLLEIIKITGIHTSMDSGGLSNDGERKADDHLTNRILNTTMEARAATLSVIGEDKAGDLGCAVRSISTVSARIFAMYCPCLGPLGPGPDSGSKEHSNVSDSKDDSEISNDRSHVSANSSSSRSSNGSRTALIAYICSRAIDRPALLSSNISLLLEILPMASISYSEIDKNAAYNKANNTDIDSDIDRTEIPVLTDKDSISLFALWEKFIWEKPDIVIRTESVEEVKKKEEKEREEELFKGSGSLVVPDDPLYTSLCLSEYVGDRESKISISTIILFALGSTSWELHQLATVLCAKVMAFGLNSACMIADVIVQAIQRRVALHLQEVSPSEEEEKEKFAPELSLSRLFILMETLCNTDTLCVTFVQQGSLLPVLRVLRGSADRNVCILAIQLVMTIYRTLLKITSSYDNKVKNKEKGNMFKNCLLWVLRILSDALASALPLVMGSFQDAPNGVLLWQQSVLIMSLLPSSIVKKVIETISVTFTIEGLAVKLWLSFEDSYQQLYELTELRKLCQAHPEEKALQDLCGEDFGLSAMHSAHMLYTGASCALKAVIDYALMAFLEGTIALPTLARACRCSLSDPKKVILRYQRAYTMWAVQNQQFIIDNNEKRGKKSAYSPFVSHAVVDPQCSSAFDARHELISSALRNAVETTGRVARLVSGRETRPKGGTGILKEADVNGDNNHSNISMDFDFHRPFTELLPGCDFLSQWFIDYPPSARLPRLSAIRWGSSSDTLHTVLRRGLLYGDETEVCLFDGYVTARMDAVRDLLRNKGSKRKLNSKAENDFSKKVSSMVPPPPPTIPIKNIAPPLIPTFLPPQMPTPQLPPPRPPLMPPKQQPPPLLNGIPPVFRPPVAMGLPPPVAMGLPVPPVAMGLPVPPVAMGLPVAMAVPAFPPPPPPQRNQQQEQQSSQPQHPPQQRWQ